MDTHKAKTKTAFTFQVKAEHVIRRVGGPTATALLIGVAKSQPSRWVKGQEARTSSPRVTNPPELDNDSCIRGLRVAAAGRAPGPWILAYHWLSICTGAADGTPLEPR